MGVRSTRLAVVAILAVLAIVTVWNASAYPPGRGFDAEEHITYEIERLVNVLPIQAQVAAFVHPIITQSLLEAFLVHLRSLADFFPLP